MDVTRQLYFMNYNSSRMNENQEILSEVLKGFADMTAEDIATGLPYWRTRKIAKGDFFNMQSFVCTDLALIGKILQKHLFSGIFRQKFREMSFQ